MTNICIKRDPERVEREQGEESLFKEVMSFLKPGEENGHRFKKPNRTQLEHTKKSIVRHLINKVSKIKTKEF